MKTDILRVYKREPNFRLLQFLVTVIIFRAVIWSGSVIDLSNYSGNGWNVASSIMKGIITPDLTMLTNFSQGGLWFLIFETLCIALIGTILGAILALPLAFLASSNIVPAWLSYIFNILIMVIRTVPAIIYGLMFIRVTGPGPSAGVLTMTFTSIGMLTKLFSEAIANLDVTILEAFSAMGTTSWQKIRFGIIPQLSASFLSTLIYRFDMNIRDATTLGLVGAGGIGAPLVFAINAYRWNEVGAILLSLVLLVLVIEYYSTKIRRRLAYGKG